MSSTAKPFPWGQLIGKLVEALIVGLTVVAVDGAATPEQIAAALRQARGRSRSRSGPPVVFLQRAPKGGAES